MGRENLRRPFRWMPIWMLKAVFFLSCVFVLLPFAIWDAVRDAIREVRRDYRDMLSEVSEKDP